MARIAIVGTGAVGTTFAYALMISGLVEEIVLIDANKEKAEGEAMDLNHGQAFVRPVTLWAGDYADCQQADIIVLTAGARQKVGESRLELVGRNAAIFRDIVDKILSVGFKGIFLVVTNPVDALTYATWKFSGFPRNKIIGSGTVLDSARFRHLIAEHCRVAPQSVHAYIFGEHGDSEVAAWSLTNIAGARLMDYCPHCDRNHDSCSEEMKDVFKEVQSAAYKIIEAKGATFYAISLALVSIVQAIIRDENRVLPVSSVLDGYYGISDVALSVPTVVNRNGVDRILHLPLEPEEIKALQNSAAVLKETIQSLTK